MNSNRFRRLADWELRHRGWVVFGIVAGSLFALAQLPRLRFDFRPEALLEFSAEEKEFARSFREQFQVRDDLLLVALRGSDSGSVLDARGLSLLFRLTESVAANPAADGAYSLTKVPRRDLAGGLAALALGKLPPLIAGLPIAAQDVARVNAQVATSRMLPRQLISEDGSTAAIVMVIKREFEDLTLLDQPLGDLQVELEGLLSADAADAATNADRTYEIHLGGLPFIRLETVRKLKSEQRSFWPLTAALYLFFLWVLYRDLGLAVTPLLAVGLASLWGIALLPLVGSEVNVINNIVPSLILVIGVCNAIHMLHAYVEARRGGASGEEAVQQMMAELGLPVLLTSVTTAIGFASLLVARNGTLQDLGWQASAGIMMSYLALVTLLPVLVGRFGRRAAYAVSSVRRRQRLGFRPMEVLVSGVTRWPRSVLAVALVVLVLAIASGFRVPIDARVNDTFPPGHPIYESNKLVEDELGGILPLEIHLKASEAGYFTRSDRLHHVFALQKALAERPEVLDVKSVVDLIAEVHGARPDDRVMEALSPRGVPFALEALRKYQPEGLVQFVNEEASEIRIAARLSDGGIRASLTLLEWIEEVDAEWLEPFDDEVSLRLTGEAFLASRGLDFFIRDLILSSVTAGGVIFVVLVVAFRSLRMGLLSILPTVLPLALTLGLIPFYGYQLNTSTVVVFTISIGMAVDNTIHLLTRFRGARSGGLGLEEAVRETFGQTGAAVVASNLLLIGGFGVLFASTFEPIFRVAVLTTTTIGAAMLSAILVLPALLMLWGGPLGQSK